MTLLLLSLGCLLACLVLAWREPRQLRCAVLLGFALLCAGAAAVQALIGHPAGTTVAMVGATLLGLIGLGLGVAAVVFARSDHSRRLVVLSGVLGVVYLGVSVTVILMLRHLTGWLDDLALGGGFIAAYLAAVGVGSAFYGMLYQRAIPRAHPAAVIVLGAAIKGERVTPALARRLDTAAQIVQQCNAGVPVILSGGQGAGEAISEAEAMSRYLIAQHGITEERIILEERATSTEENIEFSREILAHQGITGAVAVVTNNFHALRAALWLRLLAVPGHVYGAPVSLWFFLTAVLREYLALLTHRPLLHLAMIIGMGLLGAGVSAL